MAYKISDECILCEACVPECKNQAISVGETQSVIDPNKCTECVGNFSSPKCAEVCPAGGPGPDPAHKETKQQLLAKWRKSHPGETPAAGTY